MNVHSQSKASEDNGAKSAASARLGEEPHRNDFMAQLNQKLRTPLNAVMGFAELLEMQCDNASMTDNIKQLLKAAHDLLDIIKQELAEPGHGPDGDNAKIATAKSQCDVLYIEDDPVNFALVRRILEQRPAIKLVQAACGETGVSFAQTLNPKLVLLDLNLPDIHGSEVLQRLRQGAATAQLPVVVISADATASQIERLLSAGARNYLTKPFKIQPFLAVVDEILKGTAHSN